MTAASHEPTMHYLDSILNEEEKRCDQYSHQWRNFTISRSGRFRSKNRKRDTVDGKLFDSSSPGGKENDKVRNPSPDIEFLVSIKLVTISVSAAILFSIVHSRISFR